MPYFSKITCLLSLITLLNISGLALAGPFGSFKDILKNKKKELTQKAIEAAEIKASKLVFPLEEDGAIARPSSPGLDHFQPTTWEPLSKLPQSDDGTFLLRPGLFEFNAESYCLKPGSYEKPGGEGYMSGPIKGKLAPTFTQILKNTFRHPEISREDVQYLLWGIIAGTPINRMNPHLQNIASKLLSKTQMKHLRQDTSDLISNEISNQALGKLPASTQQLVDTYRKMKIMATQPDTNFKDMEKIAILPGEPPISVNGNDPIPRGRWTYHPGGFYIRYFSSQYWKTKIQIVVPNKFKLFRDKYHRIRSMKFDNSGEVNISYDDSQAPLLLDKISGHAIYPIKSLTFTGKNKNSGKKMSKSYLNKGYILAPYSRKHHAKKARKFNKQAATADQGHLSYALLTTTTHQNKVSNLNAITTNFRNIATSYARTSYANSMNRDGYLLYSNFTEMLPTIQRIYDRANGINDDVNYLRDRYHNAHRRATDDDLNNIVDINHYIDAARSVITDPASAPAVVIEQLEAEYLAVARATQLIEDLDKDPAEAGRYDPTREAGLPGLLGYAQRRGMSGRSSP